MLRIQKVDRVHRVPYTVLGWAVADIRQTVHHLRAAGVVFERYEGMSQDADGIWHAPSGALVAWFPDPDGHVLSLTEFRWQRPECLTLSAAAPNGGGPSRLQSARFVAASLGSRRLHDLRLL